MKKSLITFTLLFSGILILSSCGWSSNQTEAAKKSIDEGFETGLASTGAKVDQKVKEKWVDCVIEKGSKKWTFDEFSKAGPELEKIQEECAQEVGLYDAITAE